MTRSTEECEISRSCHRATSSKAAWTLARTTRARPQICSEVTGLRLCGMAELPFWPRAKYSSASRTSVRCRCRTSSAIFSQRAVARARATDESGVPVALDHLRGDRRGLEIEPRRRCALPLPARCGRRCRRRRRVLPTRRSSAAAPRRVRLRPASSYQMASLRPKVIGLGMHAVGAADLDGAAELQRAPLQHGAQGLQIARAGWRKPAGAAGPGRCPPRHWRSGRSAASARPRRGRRRPWFRPRRW